MLDELSPDPGTLNSSVGHRLRDNFTKIWGYNWSDSNSLNNLYKEVESFVDGYERMLVNLYFKNYHGFHVRLNIEFSLSLRYGSPFDNTQTLIKTTIND